MTDKLLSISEAAKLLDVCENTLRDWDIEGTFKAERTGGNHRRYSLDQIREYLDKNPPKVQDKIFGNLIPFDNVVWNEWKNTEYLKGIEDREEQKILAMILENVRLSNNSDNDPFFSTSQILWLTQQGWLRTKFKKMVSIQPMVGPASLVFYFNSAKNSVEDSAICAKIHKYSFAFFNKADFDNVKEAYADAIAYEIDISIMNLLPTINIEWIMDASALMPPDRIKLSHYYDYVILPNGYAEKAIQCGMADGVDVFEGPMTLDPKSFMPKAVGGRYPKQGSNLELPVFAPYVMLIVGPSLGPTRSAMFRAGSYQAKDTKLC